MKPTRRVPQRRYSVRDHGRTLRVFRATRDAWRGLWRRDGLSLEAMDAAADEALRWLAGVELRYSIQRSREISIGWLTRG